MQFDRNRIPVFLLGVLALVALGAVLKAAEAVVLPLIIAWLLSYILGPVVKTLARLRVPTGLSVGIVLLLLLGVCYAGGMFLYARIAAFNAQYGKYERQLYDIFDDVSGRLKLGFNPFEGINWGEEFGRFLVRLSGSLFVFVSHLTLVVIFLVFLLLGKPFFAYKLRKAFSPERATQFTGILDSISRQLGRYLSMQFLISAVTGVLVWFALTLLGVDFPVTWGVAAFLLNFIPTIGSIAASIPPILLALVESYPRLLPGILTLLALLSIQIVMGNVITPKVMGDRLNLSPVVVLLSLVFWGWLWGFAGALLAVPIASAIKIVCGNIEPLRPIGILMGSGKRYEAEFRQPRPPPAAAPAGG